MSSSNNNINNININNPLKQSLHKVIKQLNNLHSFNQWDQRNQYESSLTSTLDSLMKLLNYTNTFADLQITTAITTTTTDRTTNIGNLHLRWYSSPSNNSNNSSRNITKQSILNYLEAYQKNTDETNSTIQVLQHLISLLSVNDKQPTRIKSFYSNILLKLSAMLEQILSYHQESDQSFINYITRCFHYELKFHSDLKRKFESDMNSEDTTAIANYLDSFISDNNNVPSPPRPSSRNDENDTIFSYADNEDADTNHNSNPRRNENIELPLELESNNQSFNKLYKLFLGILYAMKSPNPTRIAYVFVNLFKKQENIDCFESINHYHNKFMTDTINRFLLQNNKINDYQADRILPRGLDDINKKVVREIVNKYNPPPSQTSQGSQKSNILPDIFENLNFDDNANNSEQTLKQNQRKTFIEMKLLIPTLNSLELDFDPEFPKLLKHYFDCYNTILSTMAQASDHQFVPRIISLSAEIMQKLDDDVDEANLKDIIYEFYEAHKLLSIGNHLNRQASLLMRASTLDYYKSKKLNKIVLRGWYEKSQRISRLNRHAEEMEKYVSTAGTKRFLKDWISKTVEHNIVLNDSDAFYGKNLKEKSVSLWKQKMHNHSQNRFVADGLVKRKFLIKMKNGLTEKMDLMKKAEQVFNNSLISKYFNIIQEKYRIIQENKSKVLELSHAFRIQRDQSITSYYFLNWYVKMDSRAYGDLSVFNGSLSEKLIHLNQLARRFVLSIYFNKWKKRHRLEKTVHLIQQNSDLKLARQIFVDNWQYKVELSRQADIIYADHLFKLKTNIFKQWSTKTSQMIIAKNFYETNTKKKFLKFLNTSSTLIRNENSFKETVKRSYWKLLLINYNLRVIARKKNETSVDVIFSNWKDHASQVRGNELSAQRINEDRLKSKVLHHWKSRTQDAVDMEIFAIEMDKRKYYDLWRTQTNISTAELASLYESYKQQHPITLSDSITMKGVLRNWRDKHHEVFEMQATEKIKMVEQMTLARKVETWRNKLQTRLDWQNEAESKIADFLRKTLVQPMVQLWRVKLAQRYEMEMHANEIVQNNLGKKFLTIWVGRSDMNKEMENKAEDLLAGKDFSISRDLVRNWNMKYHKHIKRHESQCQFFIEKMDRSRNQSIFKLWHHKTLERIAHRNNQNEEQEYIDANTSILSSSSPLASRSRRQMASLRTPVKSQAENRGPFLTPSPRKGPSPTKLQETKERMENQKMYALRQRFSRVKLTPNTSPIDANKNSQTAPPLGRTPQRLKFYRLSPPTTRTRSISPPKPPRFTKEVDFLNNRVEPEIQEGSSSAVEADLRNRYDDNMVEQAKQMKRIIPKRFPTDEEYNQMKLSNVDTLRRRFTDGSFQG
ncbi:SFI1 [[Candida] subhashii]|uniref:SFI1 n=1 Tax=[Candida] subhashii TaxID=561895 RepID=A0A8J5Q6I4_9ASCO|nr:SFI1 [[Candida] subhashii]KAG7661116.1 SFI1 [[Candida] subhashii]